jgi:CDP-diacylglycerol--glycerol-3-phosphate 3-phosphatidyltransferase
VARLVAKTGVTPNALTILGFLLIIGVAWVLSQGYFLLGGFLVVIASSFDFIDGALARVTGRSTRFGALLDSSLDRYSEAVLLFGLLWFYAWQGATLEILLIFAAIVGSLLVSYVRARAEGLGLDAEVGIMRRTVRILTLAIGLMVSQLMMSPIEYFLLFVALCILAILTNLTAAQRLLHVWRYTRKEQPEPQDKSE